MRIQRDAVTAYPWPGRKLCKTKGLGSGCFNDLPGIQIQRSHIIKNSLTMAMFTALNVFSSSFTISAAAVEVTGTIWSATQAYSAVATSPHDAVTPPITFGVFFRTKSVSARINTLR